MMRSLRSWMWTRRKMLRVLGVASGGLWVGASCSEDRPPEPDSSSHVLLERAIRKRFHYLSIEQEVITTFARDLTRAQGAWHPTRSPRPYSRFLASTDFFQNGADESKPLRYIRYYDPYISPCYNPFEPRT